MKPWEEEWRVGELANEGDDDACIETGPGFRENSDPHIYSEDRCDWRAANKRAHLIAAAPELYRACQAIVAGHPEAELRALSALRKARGE